MTLSIVIFFAYAAIAVIGALLMIFLREPIHSALALVLVMVALAGLYLLLGAEFISAVQVIVYAGAVMVLFVFVIMLLNAGEEERTNLSQIAKYAGMPLGIFLLIELAYWVTRPALSQPVSLGSTEAEPTRALSLLLFKSYLFPFEATSIIILIAVLGALVLAQKENR